MQKELKNSFLKTRVVVGSPYNARASIRSLSKGSVNLWYWILKYFSETYVSHHSRMQLGKSFEQLAYLDSPILKAKIYRYASELSLFLFLNLVRERSSPAREGVVLGISVFYHLLSSFIEVHHSCSKALSLSLHSSLHLLAFLFSSKSAKRNKRKSCMKNIRYPYGHVGWERDCFRSFLIEQ